VRREQGKEVAEGAGEGGGNSRVEGGGSSVCIASLSLFSLC
jgi:hypothetical protein